MKLNQELITKLRNGEIAAENNGTLEQLREVIREAFPKNQTPMGRFRYYFLDTDYIDECDYGDLTNLPIKSISDFYQPEQRPSQGNPIHYLIDGVEYSFNYQELKFRYEDICQYSDEQFMEELPEIAHLACIVSYLKGLGAQATIGDKGIVHELLHLMTEPDEPTNSLQEVRKSFNDKIKLV